MNLIYVLKASAIIAVLWLTYRFLLRKDTFFGIKRLYFIAGMFLSFLLPLWHIKKVVLVQLQSNSLQIQLNGNPITPVPKGSHWFDVSNLSYVLLAGVLFFIIKMLADLFGIYRLIASGEKAQKNGYVLVSVDKDISPFSFGKYVVVNPEKFTQEEFRMLIAHEWVHIRQKHSLDVLLSGIFTALQWYNPFAWLWRRHLIENLEFIADSQATTQVPSVKNYQYLLLKTGMDSPALAMANSFYKPNLKNRIMMLQQKKTQSIQLVKFGILLPLIALFLFGFNTREVFGQETPNPHYVIDKHTTSKQLKDIENQINNKADSFSVHFDDIMYTDDLLVNVGVLTHYLTTGKDVKLRIEGESKKGILKTIFHINDGKLVISQTQKKTFSINDDGVVLSTFDNKSKTSTTSTVQAIHYDKDGKVIKTGTITYKDKTYFYVKTGNNYHFFDRFGTEVDKKIADILQQKLTGGQVFIVDNSIRYKNDSKHQPLYVLNGKIISKADFDKINQETISKMSAIKGNAAIKKYGDKGKNGVIEIFTK